MSMRVINSREAYTEKELIFLVKNKMKELGFTELDLYKKYNEYFLSEDEVTTVLSGDVYFNYDVYKFLSEFLRMPIEELTKEVEDDIESSARGKVDHEDQLINVLNFLYDEMIKHRRFNSEGKTTSNKYLSGEKMCSKYMEDYVEIFKKEFNIGNKEENYPLDLFKVLENEFGFYLLRFPNEVGISGLTIVKNSVKENEKYICIYVNTNEPVGRQMFTLAHEIYHILFEKSDEMASYSANRMQSDIEKRAEEFASRLIIPRDLLIAKVKALKKNKYRSLNVDDIVELQKQFNVSFQAIVYVLNNTSSKNEPKFGKYYENLPKPLQEFNMAYSSETYRQKIAEETKKYTNLNLIEDDFILPKSFEDDLKKSFEKNIISNVEYNEILEFFHD